MFSRTFLQQQCLSLAGCMFSLLFAFSSFNSSNAASKLVLGSFFYAVLLFSDYISKNIADALDFQTDVYFASFMPSAVLQESVLFYFLSYFPLLCMLFLLE